MANERGRPARFGGFWALAVGALVVAGLLVWSEPVLRAEDCANYGGNGNASAFGDPAGELALLLSLPAWLVAVGVEQLLPVTRRDRDPLAAGLRALAACVLSVVGSCWLLLSFATRCH